MDIDKPKLLRMPKRFGSVEEVLNTARQLELSNILVLSEKEDGSLVFLETEMTYASTNWLLDKMKTLLLMPDYFEKKN